MTIVVYEGVFDPPHISHMWLAQLVAESGYSKVIVVPSSDKAAALCSHKNHVTDQDSRLLMCRESFKDLHPSIVVSDIAIKLGLVYTVDVVSTLQSLWPSGKDIWYWLCGSDWLEFIPSFHDRKKLEVMAKYLVVEREGFSSASVDNLIMNGTGHGLGNPLVSNLSSTFIRDRVKNGKSVVSFVTPYVNDYIKTQSLYKD
jgi:nicotinate-nucleotide adenylyltransferase